MLAYRFRLPSSTVFQHSRILNTPFFRVMIQPNGLSCNRFGFVVSKKVDKRAVVRNRIKRVLRESVRDFLENSNGKDVLFLTKQQMVEAGSEIILQEVCEVMKNV